MIEQEKLNRIVKNVTNPCVLFLGAGASKPLDFPVMNEFFERAMGADFRKKISTARRYNLQRKTSGEVTDNEENIKYLLIQTAYLNETPERYDLERVLGFLSHIEDGLSPEALKLYEYVLKGESTNFKDFREQYQGRKSHFVAVAQDIKNAGEFFREKIYEIFGGAHARDMTEKAFNLYEPVLSAFQEISAKVPIFTTNYDGVFEGMHNHNRLKDIGMFCDGLDKGGQRDNYWNIAKYEKPSEATLYYFKLHGSLSWEEMPDGLIKERGSTETFPARPKLVWPVGEKLGIDVEPFDSLYQIFSDVLSNSKKCVVIGFSFRDQALRDIFLNALKRNRHLKILAVDPTVSDHLAELINEFSSDRIHHIDKGFGEQEVLDEIRDWLKQGSMKT